MNNGSWTSNRQFEYTELGLVKICATRMHSSRMRTARSSIRQGGLHQAPPPHEQTPPGSRHPPPGADTTPPGGDTPPPVNRILDTRL